MGDAGACPGRGKCTEQSRELVGRTKPSAASPDATLPVAVRPFPRFRLRNSSDTGPMILYTKPEASAARCHPPPDESLLVLSMRQPALARDCRSEAFPPPRSARPCTYLSQVDPWCWCCREYQRRRTLAASQKRIIDSLATTVEMETMATRDSGHSSTVTHVCPYAQQFS